LRNQAPVYWMESLRSWMISRYEDVAFVAKNTQLFSSAPRGDLISALVRAEEESQALSPREVLAMCMLLLLGGNETTTNLLGSTIITLLAHPDEFGKVLADPSCIPQMIEEMLRYESPVQAIFRSAISDAEIAGTKIAAGDTILIFYGSANRD